MEVLFSPDWGLVIWSAVSFFTLFLLLKKMAYKPILNMMKKREETIKASLDKAEETRVEAERLFEEYKNQLDEARKEAQKIIEEGRAVAENAKQEINQKANEEAKKILDSAQNEIRAEKEKALVEIQTNLADLVVEAASKVVQKSLDKENHLGLIEDYTTKLRELT